MHVIGRHCFWYRPSENY